MRICRSSGATVTAVESADGGVRVALDRTAFYPGGGGQPNDTGVLVVDGAHVPVTKVKKRGRHRLALAGHGRRRAVDYRPAAVHGAVDWDHRYCVDAHAHGHAHSLRRGLAITALKSPAATWTRARDAWTSSSSR
ncbi:MAG: alanine--tRNA ligase-related protein [Caldilineaceae bacterium]